MGNAPRIGIIGVGVISGIYLQTLTARSDVTVAAIADLDMDRAAAVASGIPGARAPSRCPRCSPIPTSTSC